MSSSAKASKSAKKAAKKAGAVREKFKPELKLAVLTEAGYRCGNPTCRGILALDLHHLDQVSNGGGNIAPNLIALCPTCHALHHRGTIPQSALYLYKAILVSLTRAFDLDAIDKLIFLRKSQSEPLKISGDGVLSFARLIASDLASFELQEENGPIVLYSVQLTPTGCQLIDGWIEGDRGAVQRALSLKSTLAKAPQT